MSYVFLSHSHADKPFVRRLASHLRHHGHIVWIDEAEILVGDSLITKIGEGLDRVEYVLAVLSKTSVKSEWVKKELDIAMNKEIGAKRVVVLPILLDDVDLPQFLVGKKYADFRDGGRFEDALTDVVRALGRGAASPRLTDEEIAQLKIELESAKAVADYHAKEGHRQRSVIMGQQSAKLRAAIDAANTHFPDHRVINEAYAFEISGLPMTLDGILWAVAKEQRKGAHPLAALLTIENKWDKVKVMIEAYADYLGLQTGGSSPGREEGARRPARKGRSGKTRRTK
jgi:hypothetical protein